MAFPLYSLLVICDIEDDFSARDLLSDNSLEWQKLSDYLAVTGFLLFKKAKMLQYFEGGQEACNFFYNKFNKELVYKDVTILMENNIKERHFNNWFIGNSLETKYMNFLNKKVLDDAIYHYDSNDLEKLILKIRVYHQKMGVSGLVQDDTFISLNLVIKSLFNQHRLFLISELVLLLAIIIALNDLLHSN